VVGDEPDRTVHPPHDLLEGGERGLFRSVQVGLVHFVSQENEVILFAELHELLLRCFIQQGTGRITRVDDDQRFRGDAFLFGLGQGSLDLSGGGGPAFGFVEVVGQRFTGELGQGGSVKWVLRDGDQDSGRIGIVRSYRFDQHLNQEGDTE